MSRAFLPAGSLSHKTPLSIQPPPCGSLQVRSAGVHAPSRRQVCVVVCTRRFGNIRKKSSSSTKACSVSDNKKIVPQQIFRLPRRLWWEKIR